MVALWHLDNRCIQSWDYFVARLISGSQSILALELKMTECNWGNMATTDEAWRRDWPTSVLTLCNSIIARTTTTDN